METRLLSRRAMRLMFKHEFDMEDVGDNKRAECNQKLKEAKIDKRKGYHNAKQMAFKIRNFSEILKIYQLGKKAGFSEIQTEIRWAAAREDHKKEVNKLSTTLDPFNKFFRAPDYSKKGMPKLPKQDNKGYYHGSGSSGSNRVRYPSKKRSKRVWKVFYDMFPGHAKADGWDGEKSSRYNSSNKK